MQLFYSKEWTLFLFIGALEQNYPINIIVNIAWTCPFLFFVQRGNIVCNINDYRKQHQTRITKNLMKLLHINN